jgi:hypothetical protein
MPTEMHISTLNFELLGDSEKTMSLSSTDSNRKYLKKKSSDW